MSGACAIILNWNGWQDTIECLESVLLLEPCIETIIVCDNASSSSDGSREKILSWAGKHYNSSSILVLDQDTDIARKPLPFQFVFIQNHSNLGYAGGNNTGIRFVLSQGAYEYVWILNNDTVVHPQALSGFLVYARSHADVGILGSTVVHFDRKDRVQCAGGCRYYPLTTIFRPLFENEILDDVLCHKPKVRLDYVYGTSMFVRVEVFERVGLLNEEYFLFYEELDFCERAKRAGFEIGWCPDSIVFHKGSSAIGRPDSSDRKRIAFANYHENLSTLKFTQRFYPWVLPIAMVCRFVGKLIMIAKRRELYLARPLIKAYLDFMKVF
jgi:GT2 family glycosyltransferase